MDKIVAFSIKYGKFFHFLSLCCIAGGFFVYVIAKKDFLPPVKDSFITVQTIYPGASPESVRESVTAPIEKKLSEIPEADKAFSSSKKNISIVTLQLKREEFKARQAVFQRVQEKVRGINLPEAAEPPEFFSRDYTDFATISIHLEGAGSEGLSYKLQQVLRNIKGIKAIEVLGRPDSHYLIEASPLSLQKRGIPMGELMQAVQQAFPDIPGGELEIGGLNRNISIFAPWGSIDALENIVIRANENLDTARVRDVAKVLFEPKKKSQLHRLQGQEGIVLGVSKTADTDLITFNKAVKKAAEEFFAPYPQVKFRFFNDFSMPVESRLGLLNGNLSFGLALVFLMLLIFFNLRTTFWTTMGIPVAFGIGALVSILGMGITINIASMIGFIVVVGIVVDDAVVLSENSYRYLEKGLSPYDAVVTGMSEVLPSVFFAVSTTVFAVISIYFVGGKIGEQAFPLVTVIPLTLLGSLMESILVLPGHLVHSFSNAKKKQLHEAAWRARFFSVFYTSYRKVLGFLIKKRKISLACFTLGAFGLAFLLSFKVPFIFFGGPPNEVIVQLEASPGTPLESTALYIQEIESYMLGIPQFESVYTLIGQSGDSHKASIQARLKTDTSPNFPWAEKKEEILKLAAKNPFLSTGRFFLLREDNQSKDLVDITIKGTDSKAVKSLAEKARDLAALQPNTEAPRLDTPPIKKEVFISIDPVKAYSYGLTPRAVAQEISMAFEGAPARTLSKEGRDIDITLRYPEAYKTLQGLSNLRIPNRYARYVALTETADISTAEAETEIRTEGGLYALHVLDPLKNIEVMSNNAFAVQNSIMGALAPANTLEAGVYIENEQKEANQTMRQLAGAAAFGLFTIFSLLLLLFGSYLHTIIILSIIPFILVGIYIGLFTMGLALTNSALLGIIFLLGMVVNDGIVILEFLRTHTLGRSDFEQAVTDGASLRLRSIMITTSTTAAGIMPVALGFAGNEYYMQPMAVSMMFGIIFNSLITLFFIPLLVVILEKDGGGIFTKSLRKPNINAG